VPHHACQADRRTALPFGTPVLRTPAAAYVRRWVVRVRTGLFLLSSAAILVGCAPTPAAPDRSHRRELVGTVVAVQQMASASTSSDEQREWAAGMCGALGVLVNDLIYRKPGYPVYIVRLTNEGPEIRVASRRRFVANDCVVASVPEAFIWGGERLARSGGARARRPSCTWQGAGDEHLALPQSSPPLPYGRVRISSRWPAGSSK
jgi:hypothetical protein